MPAMVYGSDQPVSFTATQQNPPQFSHPVPDQQPPPGAPAPAPAPMAAYPQQQTVGVVMMKSLWSNVNAMAQVVPWWVWLGTGAAATYYFSRKKV